MASPKGRPPEGGSPPSGDSRASRHAPGRVPRIRAEKALFPACPSCSARQYSRSVPSEEMQKGSLGG